MAGRIDRGYLGRLLQLTLLAPERAEALLDGCGPDGVGLPRLMEPFPNESTEQRSILGRTL